MLIRLLGVLAALLPLVASSQSAWTITRANVPGITISAITGVAYGNGRFVMSVSGGPSGSGFVWSADGQVWRDFTPAPVVTGGLHFINGHFYSVTFNGVSRSTDGLSWENVHTRPDPNFAYTLTATNGEGLLLATNLGGPFTFSPDLKTWRTTAPLPHADQPGAQVNLVHLAYGAGRYFVSYVVFTGTTPQNTVPTGYAASTVDGTSWTLVPQLAFAGGMAGGNGRLVAIVGLDILISTDGTTFTSHRTMEDIFNPAKLFFAGGRFFVARNLLSSIDGVTWGALAAASKTASSAMWGVAYGKGRYIAGGFDWPPPGGTTGVDVLAILSAPASPVIATQPAGRTIVEGERAEFSVGIENTGDTTTFQWRRDGAPIPGATASTYVIPSATAAHNGRYTVEIRNPLGSVLSATAALHVVPPSEASRIVNLSVLTSLDTAADSDAFVTVGFVVGGPGTRGAKPLLIRAGGPSLIRFGVGSPHPDPRLELYAGAARITQNDNWGGTDSLLDTANRVGAFPFLAADSKDAAVFAEASSASDSTMRIRGASGSAGSVIAEVYDATPPDTVTNATPRLVNVSVMKPLGSGDSLTAGFVIAGATTKTVLIRVIGPTLDRFGVSPTLSDPQLAVYRAGTAAPIATNEDWRGTSTLSSAFDRVAAFPLPPASRDAALLLTLQPGDYVAQAMALTGSGNVLVEIYEIN